VASLDSLQAQSWQDAAVNADAAIGAVISELVSKGAITSQALQRGRRAADESQERLDHVLNKLGLVSDDDLTEAWSVTTGLSVVEPDAYPERAILEKDLNADFLKNAGAIPLALKDGTLLLAVIDAANRFIPAAVKTKTGLHVVCKLAKPGEFAAAFQRLYGAQAPTEEENDDYLLVDGALSLDIDRLRDLASDAPVIRLVSGFIDRAIEIGASDLHISAGRSGTRIRYRVDGILRDAEPPPAHLHEAVISRLKIMANLDIAERRLPQDGRIRIAWRGREIDLRIATMPHMNGEGATLRVLDRAAVKLDFQALGYSQPLMQGLKGVLAQPHGIFLVTGPTGSGKTTTLYAALASIVRAEQNILSVEDPVEYQLDGVNQIQVNRKIGLDFAGALRAILRQDPDAIMVGEIRDSETARVANQAALTGHLVLATVHTNTAAGALPRLIDMGVEPYLLASTMRASMAQRLVRRLCPDCRQKSDINPWQRQLFQCHSVPLENHYEPRGCAACQGTGYSGRVVIAELMLITDEIRAKLLNAPHEQELADLAQAAGMPPLIKDGLDKVASGITSLDEVLRAAGAS
jgi:general secretion pathway protein E